MLQAGKLLVPNSMRSFEFLIDLILSGSTQPLTEICVRHLPGGKGWQTRKACNFTIVEEQIV
jgi:hypothetical protein